MIDIENIPKLVLAHGAHVLRNVEYIGGHVVQINDLFTDKEGNAEESYVILSLRELQQIIDWINDIPNIDRKIKKDKFTVIE